MRYLFDACLYGPLFGRICRTHRREHGNWGRSSPVSAEDSAMVATLHLVQIPQTYTGGSFVVLHCQVQFANVNSTVTGTGGGRDEVALY